MAEEEVDRCWICLGTSLEKPPHGLPSHSWKRPCKCALVSHECCLLDWASGEISAKGLSEVRCPQCGERIYIKRVHDFRFLRIRNAFERASSSGFQVLVVSTVATSAVSAVYSILYGLGAMSIRCLCPRDMALKLLGLSVDTASATVMLRPLSWRQMLYTPSIPLFLIFSGSRSTAFDLLSILAPLGLATMGTPPWKFSGARLSVALLPWARVLYRYSYNRVMAPIFTKLLSKLRPTFRGTHLGETSPARAFNFMLEVGVNDANGLDNPAENQPQMEEAGDEEAAAAAAGIRRTLLWTLMDRLFGAREPAPIPADFADNNDGGEALLEWEEQQAGRHRENFVLNTAEFSLTVCHALLLPLLSGISGSLLSYIPIFRKLIPSRFNRNLVGGAFVVVARDIINLITTVLRVYEENSLKVLDRSELDSTGT